MLNTGAVPVAAAFTKNMQAKLSIHSGSAVLAVTGRSLERLRALYVRSHQGHERLPLSLRVEDSQGSEWFSMENVGPQIDMMLPAGTYNVTAVMGHLRRSYTMTLQPGSTLDLRLPRAMPRD
jgi:hypothetical protein